MSKSPDIVAAPVARKGKAHLLMLRLLHNRGFVIGFALIAIIAMIGILGPFLLSGDPLKVEFRNRFAPPSFENLFGTDHYGRDIFLRIVYGTRLTLLIGSLVVVISGIFGTLIGLAAGYFRRLDNPLMRVMDALMAFPSLTLAIAIAAALGSGLANLIIALGIAFMPRTARVVRAAVLGIRDAEYVESARLSGCSRGRVLLRHIMPNSTTPLVVDLTFVFAYAVLADAALSFLGVGPPPPIPTWGNIIAEGRDYIIDAPWITIFPGLSVAIVVLTLNLLGDGLRDVLDPRLKSV